MATLKPWISRWPAVALGLAALALACGGNRIFINLDIDSYMTEEDRSFSYLRDVVSPPLGWIDPDDLPDGFPDIPNEYEEQSEITELETPEGINEIVALEMMQFTLAVELRNNLISRADIIDIYAAMDPAYGIVMNAILPSDEEMQADPVRVQAHVEVFLSASDDPGTIDDAANRVMEIDTEIVGNATTPVNMTSDNPAFLSLFQDNEVIYALTRVHLEVPADTGTGMFEGVAVVTTLHMHAEATEDMF